MADELALWVDGSPVDPNMLTVDTVGSFLERISDGLGTVADVLDARKLVTLATAVAELTRLQHAAKDVQQAAERLVVLATWRLGTLAAEERAAGRLAARGRPQPGKLTATDLGVSSKQLKTAETLAAHPLDTVESAVAAQADAGGVVTTAGTLRRLGDPPTSGYVDRRVALTPAQWQKVDTKGAERGWTTSEVLRRLVDRMT